jgi:hypothetical protein
MYLPIQARLTKNRDLELLFRICRILRLAVYSAPWSNFAMLADNRILNACVFLGYVRDRQLGSEMLDD